MNVILGNVFGLKTDVSINTIFKIKKHEIFKVSSDIILNISNTEEDNITCYGKDITGYMFEYMMTQYINNTCGGMRGYIDICNAIRMNRSSKLDTIIILNILVYNILLEGFNSEKPKKYNYIKRFDTGWQGRGLNFLYGIDVATKIAEIPFYHYKLCSVHGIKYKSEILAYIILNDLIEQTVERLSKLEKTDDVDVTQMIIRIPQYIIEETQEDFIIHR